MPGFDHEITSENADGGSQSWYEITYAQSKQKIYLPHFHSRQEVVHNCVSFL